jgi:hypothetical protein
MLETFKILIEMLEVGTVLGNRHADKLSLVEC